MAYQRTSIADFSLANDAYPRARVTFYTVDDDGEATSTLATLYAGLTGATTLANPQTLDSEGKFQAPVYIEDPVIAVVSLSSGNVETGVIRPPLSSTDADTVAARLGVIQNLYRKMLGLYSLIANATQATEAQAGVAELATNAETATGTDDNRIVTPLKAATNFVGQGRHTINIPGTGLIPRTTNGAATASSELTNLQNLRYLNFDAATQQYAQAWIEMPKSWDGGAIYVEFIWSASSSAGNVVWQAEAILYKDDDALDAAFGSSQTVTDTLLATGDKHRAITPAITPAGTAGDNNLLCVQVSRKAADGSDTLGADARLLAINVLYTVDLKNDA